MSRDCVTICSSYAAFAAPQYRFGKNSVTTFSSTCGDIIKIVFICTDNNPATGFSEPIIILDGNDGEWEGRASEVTFVAGNKQVRATRIDVWIDDIELMPPVITPRSGTYYSDISVTISCQTSGARLYFTTDGSDPTTASTPYTGPFMLSANTTVKAIAERDGEVSEVVSAEYRFETAPKFRCFEDMSNVLDETVVQIQAPLRVLAQNNNHLYVKDECDEHALIFGNVGQTYKNGDVIPQGVLLARDVWAGEPEYRVVGGFLPATANTPIDPETITADQVGHDMFAHYVQIKDATITRGEDDRDYILTDAEGNQCAVYFSMGVQAPKNLPYYGDIIGIVGSYSRGGEIVYQLLPTRLDEVIPIPIFGFGMFEDLDDGSDITMYYDATIIYQFKTYLYVKDETGYGLVYGDVGKTYKMGDVIPAGFGGVKDTYRCALELTNPHGFQAPKDNVELVPEIITPAVLSHSLRGHYVVLKGVKLDKGRIVIMDEMGNTCPYFNRFQIVIPGNDDPDALYNVYGIVEVYCLNGGDEIIEILPIRIEPIGGNTVVCCIEDVLEYPQGEPVQFECPLIVVYQGGNYLFVKDKCGQYTLMYGNKNGTFVNGDSIIGAVTWTLYQGIPQLTAYEPWELVNHGPKVDPVGPMMIEEISRDMVHWYVYFEDVTVTRDVERDRFYTMTDENGEEMVLYNRYDIEIPTDYLIIGIVGPELNIAFLNKIIEYILTGKPLPPPDPVIDGEVITWKPCRVEGLVSIYQNQLELVPTRVTYYGTNGGWDDRWYDLNNDGVINISDLNLGIELILKSR